MIPYLTGRDSDVRVILEQATVAELSDSGNWPGKTSPEKLPGQGDVNDDFLINGLGSLGDLLEVLAAGESDPASKVDETNSGDLHIIRRDFVKFLDFLGDDMFFCKLV